MPGTRETSENQTVETPVLMACLLQRRKTQRDKQGRKGCSMPGAERYVGTARRPAQGSGRDSLRGEEGDGGLQGALGAILRALVSILAEMGGHCQASGQRRAK